MKILIALFACLAFGLGSCASDDQSMSQAMNTTCPISGEPVKASVTSVYEGETIAFCCPRCQTSFENMSSADKAAAVAKVK